MYNDELSAASGRSDSDRSSPRGGDHRSEPRSGSVVAGRYQVDRLIARGGMSTVYLAHQTNLMRPVALKVLTPPPQGEEAAAFEQRFQREAQTLASLDHPNIVVLYDYGETDDGRYFLAMEYIDGPRLSDLLKDGPLPVQRALSLLIQVCAGLRYSHKRGVVHRDLKPSNLLIRQNDDGVEQVKIVDFGLVKLTETDQAITRAGLILGSPHCMSPEQVKGLDVDHRADIYAVGVLLFRTITGHYPFHGTNSAATMVAHLNHPTPTFYSVAPEVEVPPGLEEVVRRCLAKVPGERFANLRELIDALTPLMDVQPEGIRTMTQSSSILSGVEPRRVDPNRAALAVAMFGGAAILAAVLVLIGLVALGGLLVTLPSSPPAAGTPPAMAPATPPALPTDGVPAAPVEAAAGEAAAGAPTEAPPGEPVATEPAATHPASPEPAASAPRPKASRPSPRPKPVAEPVAAPAPAPDAPQPAPAPAREEPTAPEGYLGLPDDLIE